MAFGLLTTLFSLAAGLYALQDNGVTMDSTFSEIVAAAQNAALGQFLANEGHSVAARKSAKYLEKRIMYGDLLDEDGDDGDTLRSPKGGRGAAFGFQGQVTVLT